MYCCHQDYSYEWLIDYSFHAFDSHFHMMHINYIDFAALPSIKPYLYDSFIYHTIRMTHIFHMLLGWKFEITTSIRKWLFFELLCIRSMDLTIFIFKYSVRMYESFFRYNITQMGFNVVYRVYFYLEFKRNFGYFFRIFEDFFRNFEISLEFWIFRVIFSLRTSLEILGPSLEILGLLFGICPIVFGHFFFFFGTFFRNFFFSRNSPKKNSIF